MKRPLGEGAGSGLRDSRHGGVGFCGLWRSQMLFCFTKTLVGGCPRTPETTVARHGHGHGAAGAGSPDGAAGHAATASRSAGLERASTRFRSPILRREDVEFLGRTLEAGGTPTLPGVEFVRYSRSHGLGFRQTAPKTPRMAVRPVFPGSTGIWVHDLDRCTQWAKERSTGGSSIPRRSRPSSRPTVRRGSGRPSRRPRRGYARPWPPRRGSGGWWSTSTARRSRGGPETQGQRGRSPPPASGRGRTECGHTE